MKTNSQLPELLANYEAATDIDDIEEAHRALRVELATHFGQRVIEAMRAQGNTDGRDGRPERATGHPRAYKGASTRTPTSACARGCEVRL